MLCRSTDATLRGVDLNACARNVSRMATYILLRVVTITNSMRLQLNEVLACSDATRPAIKLVLNGGPHQQQLPSQAPEVAAVLTYILSQHIR